MRHTRLISISVFLIAISTPCFSENLIVFDTNTLIKSSEVNKNFRILSERTLAKPEVHTNTISTTDLIEPIEAIATCPAGRVLTGGGCQKTLAGNDTPSNIVGYPRDSSSWLCRTRGGSPDLLPVVLKAYAICL